jgi:hypothetical protein
MNRRKPPLAKLLFLFVFTFGPVLELVGQTPAERREEMKEWINLQKIISEESSGWKVEKAVVEDMIRVLEMEKNDLEERIEAGKSAVTTADTKRTELESERDLLRSATESLSEALPGIEASVRTLYASFPDPLKDTVAQLHNRIPVPGTPTRLSLAERLQSVVGILSQADKFNSVVTEVSENRTVGGGNVIVETLYFGLGGAIYSDAAGTTAGILYPTADGWESKETPEHTDAILAAMAVYQNTAEASFVELPVSIK